MTIKFPPIIALLFKSKESFNKIFPFTNKLESIRPPLETSKESLKFNPASNIKRPPTRNAPFTYIFESINALPFANKESFNKIFPFTNKLESIRPPLETTKESLKFKPASKIKRPPTLNAPLTYKFESINALAFANNESVIFALPVTVKRESILAFNLSALRFNFSFVEEPELVESLLIALFTNKVVAIVLSELVESGVTAMGRPFKTGEFKTLFVNVSAPSKVAKVPVVGNITLLAAVVVIVKSPIPLVIMLLAIEIVLPLLFIPVPPLLEERIALSVTADSDVFELAEDKA